MQVRQRDDRFISTGEQTLEESTSYLVMGRKILQGEVETAELCFGADCEFLRSRDVHF